MKVFIQYEFEIRFPLSKTKTILEDINYIKGLQFYNLKDLITELGEKYKISNNNLDFRICPYNYDLIVKGKFKGYNHSQETFFEIVGPYVRDFEIYVIINVDKGETIIIKWVVNNGLFEVLNHILENRYDEGINDIPLMDDNELFISLEDFGLDFEHVLEVMQHQEESKEEREMEISEDSESKSYFCTKSDSEE